MLKKFKKTISIRTKPINLKKVDEHLFVHEYKKIIHSSSVKTLKNVYVIGSRLKKYRHFRFAIKQQRMNPVNVLIKIKYFLSDLREFIFNHSTLKPIIIEKATWAIDSRSNQYFHWLTDGMQRVNVAKEFLIEYPIVLTENFNNTIFIKESLEFLNLNPIYLDHNKNYLIKELILSERVSPAGNYRKEIINEISDNFKSLIPYNSVTDIHKYIWISRQNTERRKVENFDDIKEILLKYGFHILEFENISFFDQVKIMSRCEILAGVHGAGLVNMLFMKNAGKVIEVRGKNDSSNNCFFSLASDLELDYYYYLSETVDENYYSSNHTINPSLFEKFIKELMSQE